jgi:hypothetical protein
MTVTSCLLCSKTVLITYPTPEDNKAPKGHIVCKKCYWLNFSPEKMKGDKRDLVIDKVIKKKWYKLWI